MLEKFFSNPWVYGIGTTLIAGVVLIYFDRKSKNKSEKRSKRDTTSGKVEEDSLNERLTPKKINEYLNSIPTFQRDNAADGYIDIIVKWSLNFSNGSKLEDGMFHLMMKSEEGNSINYVSCKVKPEDYPDLKIIHEGQPITIEGQIQRIRVGVIGLKNCTLTFI